MVLSRGHRRKLARQHAKAERCIDTAAQNWRASLVVGQAVHSRELHRGAFHHAVRQALPLIGREAFIERFLAELNQPTAADAAEAAIDYWANVLGIKTGGTLSRTKLNRQEEHRFGNED